MACAPPLYVHLQYDPDSSGFISTERFRDLLAAHGSELDPHKLEVLLALADGNADGKICYQDFVNLVSCRRTPFRDGEGCRIFSVDLVSRKQYQTILTLALGAHM